MFLRCAGLRWRSDGHTEISPEMLRHQPQLFLVLGVYLVPSLNAVHRRRYLAARECAVRGETDRAALLREASTPLRAVMRPDARRRAGKPQVVWPNGVLASAAVGLFMQLFTPWHAGRRTFAFLEYDGDNQVLQPSPLAELIRRKAAPVVTSLEVV